MHNPQTEKTRRIRHILSVDVEDYFQVEAFANEIPRNTWEEWPSRVVENTRRILDLFDRHNTKGTFFFLGWVASRFPALVREVQAGGHELACHSYWHRRVSSLTLAEFREDVRISKDAIEQASGVQVCGYRAPSWSIDKSCLWALEILGEKGFLYDSSIYPIRHDIYGFPDAPRFAYVYKCRNGRKLTEIPPPTVRIAGFNFPGAGGGYFRILPFLYTESVFRIFEWRYQRPVVTYFHPWEIDSEQPRIPTNVKSRFRHYTNLGVVEKRLDLMLQKYLFGPIATALVAGELFGREANPKKIDTEYQRFPAAPAVSSARQSESSKG
ncbi:MAG TPA: XrtA system polysaccharide deacetylase [Candidatus Acidoferrum sp.]|nr:XrtA system polysaccharide deacetylase [Candidatus Acidoferrum sp.]